MAISAKICGLTTREALTAANHGGADYVGFVFHAQSPRYLEPTEAAELARAAAPSMRKVAVTVDADDRLLAAIIATLAPDILQLHGHETIEQVASIKARFGVAVMKAIAIAGADDVARAHDYEDVADFLLFDARPPKTLATALPGGNGLAFDWTLIAAETWRRPWLLSGGLTADNVQDAIASAHAPGVDVSSGVERRPGEKDPALIKAFLAAVKSSGNGAHCVQAERAR